MTMHVPASHDLGPALISFSSEFSSLYALNFLNLFVEAFSQHLFVEKL